ncbi:Hypothetical protein PBC10988_36200 [Planctomycetales bacterium 10988]|nr:Hypothetical protein PBC10988_36200 [Planctomycetales bacterium 10988]
MLEFLNPALFPFLWLAAIPIAIHLLNLTRRRRVQWAAMEFLLESQRKNRAFVWLRQLLLLLLRMAAIAILVLIFARMVFLNDLTLLQGNQTHHMVILDDSFSMSAQDSRSETPFLRAQQAIVRLGQRAADEGGNHRFTLLRTSQTQPDFLEKLVQVNFAQELQQRLEEISVSSLSSGPESALEQALEWLPTQKQDQKILYLVSDFRSKDWEDTQRITALLREFEQEKTKLVLIQCEGAPPANLSLSSLRSVSRTLVADVPLFLEVAVTNFSQDPQTDVELLIYEDNTLRPGSRIDLIPPGETRTKRFQVRIPTAGNHTVRVELPNDSISLDNARETVLQLPLAIKTLLIDSSPDGRNARYVQSALDPGGNTKTGNTTQIELPGFLNSNDLSEFQVIYLTNVGQLDPPAIEQLEDFVKAGGGLGIFLDGQSKAEFINTQLYRNGEGFFPAPLSEPSKTLMDQLQERFPFGITPVLQRRWEELMLAQDENLPDVQRSVHPIFESFAEERNSLLDLVRIDHLWRLDPEWEAGVNNRTTVAAEGRIPEITVFDPNAENPIQWTSRYVPLVLDRPFGDGRVVSVMSSASTVWNNWARNPSYVLMLLEMQSYLAAPTEGTITRQVGQPLVVEWDAAEFFPELDIERFQEGALENSVELAGEAANDEGDRLGVRYDSTFDPGIYSVALRPIDGSERSLKTFAYNVNPTEGNLQTVSSTQLATIMEGITYTFTRAGAFRGSDADGGDIKLYDLLLYWLVILLLLEQTFAYFQSYHPPATAGVEGVS